MLRNLAKQMARRQGRPNEQPIYNRLVAKVTAVVWRRAAKMVNACLPKEVWGNNEDEDETRAISEMHLARAGSPNTSELPAYE